MVETVKKNSETFLQRIIDLDQIKDDYSFKGVLEVLLEVIKADYRDLATQIKTTSDFDDKGKLVLMAARFMGLKSDT
jgi:hypothetical protein